MQIDEGNPNLSLHNYIEEVENMIPNHAFLRKTRKWELKFQSKLWISCFTKACSDYTQAIS